MSIKLKELPRFLNCPDGLTLLAVADTICEVTGAKKDGNVNAKTLLQADAPCLQVGLDRLLCYSRRPQPNAPTITSYENFFEVYEEKPITVGSYEVVVHPTGVQIGCTFVEWEKVRAVAALEPKTSDGIPPLEQREWRNLDRDEIVEGAGAIREIERRDGLGRWNPSYVGDSYEAQRTGNYRTKLTRAELREKRGLPPE